MTTDSRDRRRTRRDMALAVLVGLACPSPERTSPGFITPPELTDDPAADFHAHLDACTHCARNPFGLCPMGSALLERTAP